MVWLVRRILFGAVLFALALNLCSASEESPGFFLKVTKNVPRLGRRSQSINDFENFFLKASKTVPRIGRRNDKSESNPNLRNEVLPLWYNHATNQPKRLSGSPVTAKSYNNVQPFDSKSLQKLLADKAINGDDFKFISWNDFDLALESDTMLFEKLASLSNWENSLANAVDNLEPNFIPLSNANPYQNGNDYFYRIDRANNNINTDINKEKISYQA